jgi:sigma-B regulation protein RsbU (phosphoserine phosphatase)
MMHDTQDQATGDDATGTDSTLYMSAAAALALVVDAPAHYLVFTEAGAARRVQLGPGGLSVGRAAPSELVITHSDISRRHCRFDLDDDYVVVTDLGSTNGTWVADERIAAPARLRNGARLRLGSFEVKYERRSPREVDAADELERDLARANDYVQAILPPPLTCGPVQADWFFLPCATLGGDAFGYQALDCDTFAGYVLDVSGHGVGSAMHSVTVANVLRQRALPGVDFRDPGQVCRGLNAMFQMEHHNGLFLTLWYWSYDVPTRRLRFCSAGHHPAFLAPPERGTPQPLWVRHPAIGMLPDPVYSTQEVAAPPGSMLYLFSDGAFEIVTREGGQWGLEDFLPLLRQPPLPGMGEPQRLYTAVRAAAREGALDDDFSALVVTFA